MTATEIKHAEEYYQITFSSELKSFLMEILPTSPGFYYWNDYTLENQNYIRQALHAPIHALLFDI
jgi:hypothetical protein